MYRIHDVKIQRADLDKADEILLKHWFNGDIDTMTTDRREKNTVTYWIRPYIYEDLENIKNEFKLVGIQIL